ncbi:MAG: phenylalanyl-tRNA synthetase beta chain, partial [Planctomycetota bacterium]
MLISYSWLQRHVNLDGISPEELCNDLTLSTAEVEGLEAFVPQLSDVTVGHVLERVQHPDADKLGICTVDVGAGDPLQIVCGAPNVGPGIHVAVATVGTVLPGDFKIKKSKIRGVESFGMICSERELGLGEEHDGIWVLPEGTKVGQPVAEQLGLVDWIIEIDNKSLTHRPDLWGHRGIAREVAAIYGRELLPMDTSLPALGSGAAFPVSIEDGACSRYLGLAIDGVRIERSPDWMRFLLLAVGQRPLDLLVDLSNFVMLDLGQPNHAFDRSSLAAEGISVRTAAEGDSLQTLDGEERTLGAEDLLICSGSEAVALAGIMGCEGSKVAPETTQLLLEVATFAPAVIRRTSSRLGLRTDSSARFEKNLDPTLPVQAAGHFARLLLEIQPEVNFPQVLADVGDWTDPAHTLRLRTERVHKALGKAIEPSEIEDILTRLGFGVSAAPDGFDVAVPSARSTKDITIEVDLVEEVGRMHRYGNLPELTLQAPVVPAHHSEVRTLVRGLSDRLAADARFHELISYSFQSDDLLRRTGVAGQPHVSVINPVAEGESKIRRDVLPSLLGRVLDNRRERDVVRIFEVGKGYRPDPANPEAEPEEVHQLALVLATPPCDNPREAAIGQLQAVILDLIQRSECPAPTVQALDPVPGWAHPIKGLSLCVEGVDGPIAELAVLEPGVAHELGLSGEQASDVAAAVISINRLLDCPHEARSYQALSRFPGVKVDVALLAGDDLPAATLVAAIEKAGKGNVANVELFDLYRGESVGEGRKSLAFHVLLQSKTKT